MTRIPLVALLAILCAALPVRAESRPADVRYSRVTGYTCPPYCGAPYGGGATIPGQTAACSWDIPLWSTVVIAGTPLVCNDRGDLVCSKYGFPCTSWVDVFSGSDAGWVVALWGDYQDIEVYAP